MNRSVEFWSSVELATFARGLLRELSGMGWVATPRFEVTERSYRDARSLAARGRVRWRSYVSYVHHLRRRLKGGDLPSAVVICTNTFYAPAAAIRAARGLGVPIVQWVFDLFPDVLVEAGTIGAGGLGERWLGRLTRSTFEGAAASVFLGDRLLAHAESRYGPIPRSLVIPVGADGEPFRTTAPGPRPENAPVRVLYCGNLGRMHDTETVVEVLRRAPPAGWSMEFRGHGSGFRALSAAAAAAGAGAGLVLGESLSDADWIRAMTAADIALVTMKPGAEGLVMPSKTYSAMVSGQAILAVCPARSDLAETVRRHDAGWVIEPGDAAGLAAVLASAAARPRDVLAKRLNAFRAGHDHYDQKALAARWAELLASACAAR